MDPRQAKRTRLLEGATRAFLKGGFDGTTMQDISLACGVGKGTLYEYFDSKEDLFIQVCLSGFEVDSETIDHAFQRSGDPRETLASLLDAMLAEVPRLLERVPLYFTLWARLSFDPRYREKCHRGFRDLYRTFREALARGLVRAQERGTVRRDLDPRDLAALMMCALDGYTYLRVFAEEDLNEGRFERALRAVLLDGMSAPGPPHPLRERVAEGESQGPDGPSAGEGRREP